MKAMSIFRLKVWLVVLIGATCVPGLSPMLGSVDADIGTWVETTSLPKALDHHPAVFADGYIFVIGGAAQGDVPQDTAYSALVQVDPIQGLALQWNDPQVNPLPTLPQALYENAAAVANGYIFTSGGVNVDGNRQSTVYSAKILTNGQLADWKVCAPLPKPLTHHAMVAAGDYLYVLGGQTNVSPYPLESAVYYAHVDEEGIIDGEGWSPENELPKLPEAVHMLAAVTVNDYIFVVGGHYECSSTGGCAERSVISAQIQSDGKIDDWQELPDLPNMDGVGAHAVVAARDTLFVLGGTSAGVRYSTVYGLPIQWGELIWETETSLPNL